MTRMIKLIGLTVALVLAGLCMAGPANAQATRTWISGVGDDANPCSRTAPCKTFPGAISKTANGGEIDCLDPGGFGAVTITKSITIDCAAGPGGQAGSILASGTNGITINDSGTGTILVKIRNLDIQGIQKSGSPGLSGIKVVSAAGLIVEHVAIMGMGGSSGNNAAVDFEPSVTAKLSMVDVDCEYGLGDGVLIKPTSTGSAKASLVRVSCIQNSGFGLNVDGENVSAGTFAASASAYDCNFSSDNDGVVAQSFSGGTTRGTVFVAVTKSLISQNALAGALANGANATVTVADNQITNNSKGVNLLNSGNMLTNGDNITGGNSPGGDGTTSGAASKK